MSFVQREATTNAVADFSKSTPADFSQAMDLFEMLEFGDLIPVDEYEYFEELIQPLESNSATNETVLFSIRNNPPPKVEIDVLAGGDSRSSFPDKLVQNLQNVQNAQNIQNIGEMVEATPDMMNAAGMTFVAPGMPHNLMIPIGTSTEWFKLHLF